MSKIYGIAVAGLLLVMLLAGCLSGDEVEPQEQEDETPETAGEAEFSEETGALKGAVSSDLFEPLQNARIEILDMDRDPTEYQTATAADGEFVINHMEPGQYIVFVTRVGYEASQRTAQINAGALTEIRVQLEPLPDGGPYAEEWEDVGIITFSIAWWAEPTVVGCVVIPGTTGIAKSCGNFRYGADGNINFEVDEEVETILLEMVWTPAGPLGESLRLELICPEVPRGSFGAVEEPEHDCYWDSPSHSSPIIHRVDRDHWEEHGYNQTGGWQGRIFAAYGTLGTYGLTGVDAGIAYEQSFTVHSTLFYGEPAPEGYSRIPDS